MGPHQIEVVNISNDPSRPVMDLDYVRGFCISSSVVSSIPPHLFIPSSFISRPNPSDTDHLMIIPSDIVRIDGIFLFNSWCSRRRWEIFMSSADRAISILGLQLSRRHGMSLRAVWYHSESSHCIHECRFSRNLNTPSSCSASDLLQAEMSFYFEVSDFLFARFTRYM